MSSQNITLVTWHNSKNYGTCLQCYALGKYLRSKGFKVCIPNTYQYYYGIKHPAETMMNIKRKFVQEIKECTFSENLQNDYKTRAEKNYAFALNASKIRIIRSRQEYKEIIRETDVFISGSDQIWNPDNMTPPMLLSIAPNDSLKIAYGSSFGVKQLPTRVKKTYKKYLNRFHAIGVRETTGKHIVEELVKIRVSVVLDPSFLLGKKEWQKIEKMPQKIMGNSCGFAFCYFIRKNIPVAEIERYCMKKKIIPVYILSETVVIPKTNRIVLTDAGVDEFIWGIIHSDCVITDSFHAIALSINFNKLFFAYKRFEDDDIKSQNSRITDLLSIFDLSERLVEEGDSLSELNNKIDYAYVDMILKEERRKSEMFLLNAIGEKA